MDRLDWLTTAVDDAIRGSGKAVVTMALIEDAARERRGDYMPGGLRTFVEGWVAAHDWFIAKVDRDSIELTKSMQSPPWRCPSCGNTNQARMYAVAHADCVIARTDHVHLKCNASIPAVHGGHRFCATEWAGAIPAGPVFG